MFTKPEFRSNIFADGTYVDIKEDKMIVQLLEDNGFSLTDSLEVEVFKQDDANTSQYEQLKFLPKQVRVVDDILLDVDEDPNIEVTSQYVEYFFDFLVDKEIAISDICEGVKELKARDIFVDIDIECPDLEGLEVNIYSSRIGRNDIEVCD